MDNLDGKYFEGVIAALKKEKEQENFVIRNEFRENLRSQLETATTGAVGFQDNNATWVDWVLRNKFVFGGVPALAAIALVAMNSMGWGTVSVPSNQISPEGGQAYVYQGEVVADDDNKVVESPVTVVEEIDVVESDSPKIVTFSAELVMPPAEILSRRFDQDLPEINEVESPVVQEVKYTLSDPVIAPVKVESTEVEVNSYYPWSQEADSLSVPVRVFSDVFVNVPRVTSRVEERSDNYFSDESVEFIREEKFGKVVESGVSGFVESSSELPPENIGGVLNDSVIVDEDYVEVSSQQKTSIEPPVVSAVVPMVIVDDVVREAPDVELENISSPDLLLPTGFVSTFGRVVQDEERIEYEGRDRESIVEAIQEELKTFERVLSSDYNIIVEQILEGSFKATLFENDKVTRVWIITEERGEYRVVTEIVS